MYNGLTLPTAADDDLDDFFPAANSSGATNLAGIFGVALQPPPEETNTTLKYIPPKPNQVQPEKSNWKVVIARVVTAFKLGSNKQNECQGRLGFALLQQSNDPSSAKLILYRTKAQILSTALLPADKSLTFKQEYLQYTDDSNVFWSLNFASSDEAEVFLQELDKKCPVTRTNATEIAAEAIKIETELSEAAAETDHDAAEPQETVDDASKKSNIVLRMAKMGQALPALSATNQSANDTDSSISSNGGGDTNTSLLLSSVPSHSHSKPTNISVAVQPVPNYWHQSSAVANYSASNMNNFISENRVQNAEVRMNMSRMESKLERVLDSIEMLKFSGARSMRNGGFDSEEEIIKLEEKIVELKKDNRLLKLKLAEAGDSKEPTAVTASGNEQLASVSQELETVKKDVEKSQKEKVDLEAKIKELEAKLKEETEKANASTHAKDELGTKIQELEGKLKAEIESKKSKIVENAREHDKLMVQIVDMQKQMQEMTAKLAEHAQNGQTAQTKSHETIRSIMNKLYVELFQSINGRDTLTSSEVLKMTAELIRRETKAALNQTT